MNQKGEGMSETVVEHRRSTEGTAKLVYILYIVSMVFALTGIVGIVVAYVNIDDAPDWLKSHYRFQIRTFWIGGLYLIISVLFLLVVIGYFMLLVWVIWLIVRCAKGLKYLDQKQPHPKPTGWFF